MTWNDVRTEARREGRLEGKKESILELLERLGKVPEDIKCRIMSEAKESVLTDMLMSASVATSFTDYREKISRL